LNDSTNSRLIANECDEEKTRLLAKELQHLTKLELDQQSEIPLEAMLAWLCPACAISLREHKHEMVRQCTRTFREKNFP